MATQHQNLSDFDISSLPDAKHLRIGLVVAEWNSQITEKLKEGALNTLKTCGLAENNITIWRVPGSFELTYGCKKMINQLKPDALIAIGCIIRGETSHFDYVCGSVTQGITALNLQADVPVIFCVLTDDHLQQSMDRAGGKHGNKGVEAAVSALKMATLGN